MWFTSQDLLAKLKAQSQDRKEKIEKERQERERREKAQPLISYWPRYKAAIEELPSDSRTLCYLSSLMTWSVLHAACSGQCSAVGHCVRYCWCMAAAVRSA
jgi:hypothetical protein